MYNVEQIIGGKDALLASALEDPKTVRAPAPSKVASAMKTAATIAEQLVAAHFAGLLKDVLSDVVEVYVITNGEFEAVDAAGRDDWTAGLDNAIEEAIEPYQELVSADWLGKATDGTMHEEASITALCSSFGREVWRTLMWDNEAKAVKSTAKILSAIGLVEKDFAAALGAAKAASTEPTTTLDSREAIAAIAEYVTMFGGPDAYDDLKGDLDLASDSDDILATSAIERLGGTVEHIEMLRNIRAAWDKIGAGKGVEQIERLIRDYKPETPAAAVVDPVPPVHEVPAAAPVSPPSPPAVAAYTPTADDKDMAELMGIPLDDYIARYVNVAAPAAPPAPPAPPAETGRSRGRPPRATAEQATNSAPINQAMALLGEHAKVRDEDIAMALGISRATYNNMRNGKTPATLSPAELDALRNIVRTHFDALGQALDLLGE